MNTKQINQLRHCILAYETIQDTLMLLKCYTPSNIVYVAKIIIEKHQTEDEFVIGARQLIKEVKSLKPVEEYPELWV